MPPVSLLRSLLLTELKICFQKFFQPAIANIRKNLGDDSVTEQSLRIVCIQMLEEAKVQYCVPYQTASEYIGKAAPRSSTGGKSVSYSNKVPLPSLTNSDFSGGIPNFRLQYFQPQVRIFTYVKGRESL